MSLVFAFDPGKLTGVAVWNTETNEFWADQLTVEQLYEYVDSVCAEIGFAQIEKFTITQATIRKARESDPLDVIGYLKYAAWRCGFELGWSKPADVMASFPDGALRKGGMFTRGKGHANDAARHLAWYLVRNRIRPAGDFLT
jgi:hypothetical protein